MIYIIIYWLGMFGLIICTYRTEKDGKMHWKVVMMLFIISFILPLMFIYHLVFAVLEKLKR